MGANEKELKKLQGLITRTLNLPNRLVKETVKEFGKRVVNYSPRFEIVSKRDGILKANWNASIGAPDLTTDENAKDPNGQKTINEINSVVESAPPNSTYYIANALPYVDRIENGGYPKNPEKGSRTDSGDYIIRTTGGWSNQILALGQPHGMGKRALADLPGIIEQVKDKYG